MMERNLTMNDRHCARCGAESGEYTLCAPCAQDQLFDQEMLRRWSRSGKRYEDGGDRHEDL
jgi:hypothetical protein